MKACSSSRFLQLSGFRVPAMRFALALFVLAWLVSAQAMTTVGPDGDYATIQDGINAAINKGGDEVRVENLGCIHLPPKCFYYSENVYFHTPNSIALSGGWDSTFQTQTAGALSQVQGVNGIDAPIIQAIIGGNASLTISDFLLTNKDNSAGFHTHGLEVGASNSSFAFITENTISDISLDTSAATSTNDPNGGAGLAVEATDSASIDVFANSIVSNVAFGTDSQSTYAGGASVATIGSGSIVFEGNTLTDNTSTNSSGGRCRGGGLWAASLDTSSIVLQGNTYSGNSQFDCTNGATGDAAEIDTTNTAVTHVYDETWTNNNVPSDPGVYEVYMQADVSSHIFAQNGLITHGTWGGLFADSIASGSIDVSNYTIADNPSLGVRAIGAGTQIWNTLMWNDGTDEEASSGAIFANALSGRDPLFVDSSTGNYRLSMGSPAIDAGSNTPTGGLRATDLGGNPRPVNGVADIGAYEYQYPNDEIFKNGFE